MSGALKVSAGLLALEVAKDRRYLQFPDDPKKQAQLDDCIAGPFPDTRPVMPSRCKQCPGMVGRTAKGYESTWALLANCTRVGVSFGCHMTQNLDGEVTHICREYSEGRKLVCAERHPNQTPPPDPAGLDEGPTRGGE